MTRFSSNFEIYNELCEEMIVQSPSGKLAVQGVSDFIIIVCATVSCALGETMH